MGNKSEIVIFVRFDLDYVVFEKNFMMFIFVGVGIKMDFGECCFNEFGYK